jgi:uncharacterized repeat protein (TIGR02543 family)
MTFMKINAVPPRYLGLQSFLGTGKRLFMTLIVMMLTSVTVWATNSWVAAGGTGGSGTDQNPYYVNMPANGQAKTIGTAATLTIPNGVTTFKIYDDGGSGGRYSNSYDGYLIITAPANHWLQISGSIESENVYDDLSVFDNGTASTPRLVSYVSGTNNISEVISSSNVITVYFNSDGSTNRNGFVLTVNVLGPNDMRFVTFSDLMDYYNYNNGSPIEFNYTVKDVYNYVLKKGTDYTETFKKGGTTISSVTEIGDDYTLTVTGIGNYTGSKTFNFSVKQMLPGSGTKASPFIIDSKADWEEFSNAENASMYWASGIYVKMAADIGTAQNPVTTMVGTSSNRFKGTFMGDGHTLTVNYTATANDCAPFLYIDGATINLLKVTGTITTGYKYAAGIAAHSYGNSTIRNCWTSVAITSSISGDGTHAGLVAVLDGGSLNIANCLFDGSITGENTTNCGGLVGWRNATLSFTNCMMAGTMDISQTDGSSIFSRNGNPTLTNCYYDGSKNYGSITVQGTPTTSTGSSLKALLGPAWKISNNNVVPIMDATNLATSTISGLANNMTYTGSSLAVDYTVTDVNGNVLTKGTDYTESFSPSPVLNAGDYTLTISGKGSYGGTITADFTVYKMLSGSGTKANPYLISTAYDWSIFSNSIFADTYWASGVYIKMTADIGTTEHPVTTMVGERYKMFQGTFDGAGHTLTVQYGTPENRRTDMFVAPFSWTKNSLIKNLHVAGYIYTSEVSTAGIASQMSGDSKLLNCRSSMIFDSTTNGVSGIVDAHNGYGLTAGNVVIANCIFDGEFRYNGTSSNRAWYGLADNNISAFNISNCLFAPAYMNIAKTTYTTTICSSIDPGTNTINNCYYTESLKVVQGTNASGMSPAELAAALGPMWEVRNEGGADKVLPIYNTYHLSGATLTGFKPIYRYTGTEITLASLGYSFTDLEGNVLTLNTDYSVSLTCNGAAVDKVQEVGDYTITFTGEGSYSGTKEASFKVMTYPDGLSIDYDYSAGDDGYFYVNTPINNTANVDLTGEADGFTFKVYDNGGKNGKYNCGVTETVVMTAPADYVLQVVGTAKGQIYDRLCIFDGNSTSSPALYDQTYPNNIGTVISTGESMTIRYSISSIMQSDGLDLKVILVNKNSAHAVTINNPQAGGEVSSNSSSAKVFNEVTLTAAPDKDYFLDNITIINSENNNVSFNGGRWYSNNTATFTMPGTAVTVTPTFTTSKSADDGLYINMPTDAVVNATIPESVTSFKLYDDGGANGNYSRICDGTLILTAPAGYLFKLSGTLLTFYQDVVALNVYDGSEAIDENKLIDNNRSLDEGSNATVTLEPVYSTGNTMRIRFSNNSSTENTFAGLDLTVEMINGNQSYDVTINNTNEHGVIVSDKATAKTSEIVTLTATADEGYIVNGISVTDGNSQPISVEGGQWYNFYTANKATFIMPNSEATVTPTFTNVKTAEGGLYIDLKRDGIINLAIPAGIESFNVYDCGGANGDYPSNCRSTLVLTAPEGYQLKLTGTVTTGDNHDHLMVYDGTDEDINHLLLNEIQSTTKGVAVDAGTVTSTDRSMRIFLWTNSDEYSAAGIALKVEVLRNSIKHNITFDNSNAGGAASATVSKAAIDDAVALTLTPASATYLPSGLDITCSDPVKLEWIGSFSNTATMTMPYADVTVTPSFTNTWTAAGGLFAMIPKNGDVSATIPAGVQSFKIYDHSGPTANYDEHTNGTLRLTAPTGYKHQLTGTIITEHYSDDLFVRDVNAGTYLLDMISSTTTGEPLDIGTVTSSGETIYLTFRSDWGGQYAGLDLTSTLLPIEYAITYNGVDDATFATANPSVYTIESADITLNNPSKADYVFAGWYDNAEFTGSAITDVAIATGSTGAKTFWAKWKKSLEHTDITVAAIADQNYTGSAIEPAVTVMDGETDITSECDFSFSDNTNTGEATVTITAKAASANYGGETSATFTIVPRLVTVKNNQNEDVLAATGDAVITQDETGVTLTLTTPTGSTTPQTVDIPQAVEVDFISIDRSFEDGKACTLYLPFSIDVSKVAGGTFNTFTGVDTSVTPWEVQYAPVTTGTIEANTPYIFMPDATNGGKITVNCGSDKVSVCTANPHTTQDAGNIWEFVGTYQRIKWTHDTTDPEYDSVREGEIGSIYGFAAEEVSGATIGQFVKVGNNVFINPMRAYLKNLGAAAARSIDGKTSTVELPASMKVVIVGSETTGINKMAHDGGADVWYTIDGRKLDGKPTRKGMYIHNSKKVAIK